MNSKQLSYLLGAIAVVAILAAVYFAYGNRDQTPDTNQNNNTSVNANSNTNKPSNTNQNTNSATSWNTYTNSQFGFQFKYPANLGYQVKENCPDGFEKPTCSITMENSNSTLNIVIDSPGHGWFGVPNPEQTGNITIGGINTTYRYGPANSEGGPIDGTKVFLTNFTKDGNEYLTAFLYTGSDDAGFLRDVVKPLFASAKFTK